MLKPVCVKVKFLVPLLSQTGQSAIMNKLHPQTYLHVEFDEKLLVQIMKSDY